MTIMYPKMPQVRIGADSLKPSESHLEEIYRDARTMEYRTTNQDKEIEKLQKEREKRDVQNLISYYYKK